MASASCWIGTAPGRWLNASRNASTHGVYEWQLLRHDHEAGQPPPQKQPADGAIGNATACPRLRRYVHAELSSCSKRQPSVIHGAPPSNLQSCAVRNGALLASELANSSVLMLGDSTSAQLLHHTCEAFGSRPTSFIHVNRSAHRNLGRYAHRLRSLDNHACVLPGRLHLGSFSHYGVTGPPYWAFALPLAPWIANSTFGHVWHDLPRFLDRLPSRADPSLILANSGFWDIAA